MPPLPLHLLFSLERPLCTIVNIGQLERVCCWQLDDGTPPIPAPVPLLHVQRVYHPETHRRRVEKQTNRADIRPHENREGLRLVKELCFHDTHKHGRGFQLINSFRKRKNRGVPLL